MLHIGKTLKAQGIKGEIKVLSLFDVPSYFKEVKNIVIEDKEYAIEQVRCDDKYAYIKLKGVDDRNAAETIRGDVYVTEENKPKLEKGRFFITDVIGCSVVCDGKTLGTVNDIMQYGSADIYCITGEKPFMFPLVDGVVKTCDVKAGILTVDAEALARVAVYED